MEYIFGFNIGVQLYKNYPTLQIFTKNRLIDEFQLDKNYLFNEFDRELFKRRGPTDKKYHPRYTNLKSRILKLYTLNDELVSDYIEICIKNNDSNYTGGFMTKSTLLWFSNVFLIPKFFLENRCEKLSEIMDKQRKYTVLHVLHEQHKHSSMFTWADGDNTYVGEFRDGKRNGQGTYTWVNGTKYVGEWKDNKRHGQGTTIFANGQGTWSFPFGYKYTGEYKDDKQHGQGTFIWTDKTKFVGGWKDGKIHGQGTYTYTDGITKYVGEFIDGKEDGQETFYNFKTYQDNLYPFWPLALIPEWEGNKKDFLNFLKSGFGGNGSLKFNIDNKLKYKCFKNEFTKEPETEQLWRNWSNEEIFIKASELGLNTNGTKESYIWPVAKLANLANKYLNKYF
jgi:hypothetical protein